MIRLYVTFGQVHAHSVNGKTFDKDCVAIVESHTEKDAHDKVAYNFGRKYSTAYLEKYWDVDNMQYYPRGYLFLEN